MTVAVVARHDRRMTRVLSFITSSARLEVVRGAAARPV
jgi:hypothetical protein